MAFSFSDDELLVTSSHDLDRDIEEYLGVVVADVTPGRNVGKDLAASIRDVVGGRSASWEKTLSENQRTAFEELAAEAKEMGADALLAVELEDETISGGMMNVKAVGTAVRLA